MNEKDMIQLKNHLTMPPKMATSLSDFCNGFAGKKVPRQAHCQSGRRYRGFCTAAAAALFCLCAVGTTSLAYNAYQEKQLAVFMDEGLAQTEIQALGDEINKIDDISACEYISADAAWAEFKAAYFSDSPEEEAMADAFPENPLASSFNYRVSVRLGADTQAVRAQIEELPGVRKITTLREAEQAAMER